jgi:hypothetical protein
MIMRKTKNELKRFKIVACFVSFMWILLIFFAIYFTPEFVANNLSKDGILGQSAKTLINYNRLGLGILSTTGLLFSALYVIEFYSKPDQVLKKQLKLILFLFPVVFVIYTITVKRYNPAYYKLLMWREDSIIEWLSFLFYFLAFIGSFSISITYYRNNAALFFLMYMLLSIGLFFIAMEEISWGQRIFSLPTPEFLIKLNIQKEINVHNIKGLPLHTSYIIVGFYGAFSRFIIPKKVKTKYSSTVNLFVPDYYLFFYFFVVGSLYLYYDHASSIAVTLFGDWVGWGGPDHFMHGKDQEPAEFLLSCGFLLFVTINKYRQVSNKNYRHIVAKK